MKTDSPALYRLIYPLLITVAVAAMGGRILSANLVYEPNIHRNADEPPDGRRVWPKQRPEPMPTFSSNDRSRWATVRALVDQHTYVVGYRDPQRATPQNQYGDTGIVFEDGWGTVDKVLRPKQEGEATQEFFSSKPPLLATLVAGEYWLLKTAFGWSITENRWFVVRTILFSINVVPLLIYFWLLARLLERWGSTDWGRLYVLAAACFGTFLTTFATSFNNHTIAACCVLYALHAALPIWTGEDRGVGRFLLAGFFAGFAAAAELPAASFAAFLFLLLLVRVPGRTLALFTPAALVPVVAFLLTNYLAVGQLMPVYGEMGKGTWYEYEGSHWRFDPTKPRIGIDWAGDKETKAVYALHLLFGHHGLFSLSPIYLLAMAGIGCSLLRRAPAERPEPVPEPPKLELDSTSAISEQGTAELQPRDAASAATMQQEAFALPRQMLAGLTLALTLILIGFYLIQTSNYGGWTSGPRWLMWLTPLWLLTMVPAVDWLGQRRWGRILACVLLAFSVVSVSYPAWNPWRHPWLYNLMEAQEWIKY